jgi:hypothetical protein
MNLPGGFIILASLCLLSFSTPAPARTSSDNASPAADAAASGEDVSLQKKADEAVARIRANESDSAQLKKAIKTNEVVMAKEVLLRNGFTDKDLEDTKINLRTGGGKGGQDTIEIFVSSAPKEITIRRTLENFTKSKP